MLNPLPAKLDFLPNACAEAAAGDDAEAATSAAASAAATQAGCVGPLKRRLKGEELFLDPIGPDESVAAGLSAPFSPTKGLFRDFIDVRECKESMSEGGDEVLGSMLELAGSRLEDEAEAEVRVEREGGMLGVQTGREDDFLTSLGAASLGEWWRVRFRATALCCPYAGRVYSMEWYARTGWCLLGIGWVLRSPQSRSRFARRRAAFESCPCPWALPLPREDLGDPPNISARNEASSCPCPFMEGALLRSRIVSEIGCSATLGRKILEESCERRTISAGADAAE